MLALPIEIAKKKRSTELYELKVDGTCMNWDGKDMFSNRNINRNERYPHIWNDLKKMNCKCIGEVALSFFSNVLQLNKKENWNKAKFFMFDISEIDGKSVEHLSVGRKRNLIDKLIKKYNLKHISAPLRFDSFKQGWKYVNENKCEGVVLKDSGGRCHKVKRFTEEKLPVVGFEEGKAKGAFLINRQGIVSKVSGTAVSYSEAYHELIRRGETVYVEIEYSFLTDEGKPFQPKLRRLGTRDQILFDQE